MTIQGAVMGMVVSASGLTLAQILPGDKMLDAGERIARLSATAILGVALLMSLGVTGYLLRAILGKLFVALEANTAASQRAADALERSSKSMELCDRNRGGGKPQ